MAFATLSITIWSLPMLPRFRWCKEAAAANVSVVVLQTLSLSASVDVARSNHTLLPGPVTTRSHTLLFASTN